MTAQTMAVVVTCLITVGGVLIFVGRALHTLTTINESISFLFKKTDSHDIDIARMDKELTRVQTRQEDCGHCPSKETL